MQLSVLKTQHEQYVLLLKFLFSKLPFPMLPTIYSSIYSSTSAQIEIRFHSFILQLTKSTNPTTRVRLISIIREGIAPP